MELGHHRSPVVKIEANDNPDTRLVEAGINDIRTNGGRQRVRDHYRDRGRFTGSEDERNDRRRPRAVGRSNQISEPTHPSMLAPNHGGTSSSNLAVARPDAGWLTGTPTHPRTTPELADHKCPITPAP